MRRRDGGREGVREETLVMHYSIYVPFIYPGEVFMAAWYKVVYMRTLTCYMIKYEHCKKRRVVLTFPSLSQFSISIVH